MSQAAPAKPFLRTADLARRFGVTNNTIFAWVARGLLPAPERHGPKLWVWRPAILESFLAQREGARA